MPFGPQKNIKTDFGAVGDGVLVTATVSIVAGTKNLSCTTNQWVAGDAGKRIIIDGGGAGVAGTYDTKIDTFTDAQHVVLHDAATATLTNSTQTMGWGTDDSAAFTSANTFAVGQLPLGLDLLIPAGVYMLNGATPNINRWCRFIPLLKVTGQSNPTLIGNVEFGCGIVIPNAPPAHIMQANYGDSQITLKSLSDVAKVTPGFQVTQSDGVVYTSGTKLLVGVIDQQGFGAPPNPWDWEIVDLISVDSGAGVVHLAAPLRSTYLAGYPEFVAGSAFVPGLGGPASVWALDAAWVASQQFIGMQFWVPNVAINGNCQSITFTSCKWLSQFGPNPSFTDNWIADACDMSACSVEFDKIITSVVLRNGTVLHSGTFQSASIKNLYLQNSTVQNFINGTPRNTVINDSTAGSFQLGASAYGRSDSFAASNTTFTAITAVGATYQGVVGLGFTLADGLLKWPQSNGPIRFAVPGTFVMFQGTQESETGFFVKDLTDNSGVNSVCRTTLSGSAFPNVPLQGGTRLDMMAHPAPRISFSNCSGCPDAVDFSQDGARNKPIYSYSKRSYTGNTLVTPPAVHQWGRIVQVKVVVSQAYTGVQGTLTLKPFGQFSASALDPNNSQTSWAPVVDLKTAGTRVITATSVSGSAGGDSLTAPGAIWFSGPGSPFCSADVSAESSALWPIVSVEVQTDQGFPAGLLSGGSRAVRM